MKPRAMAGGRGREALRAALGCCAGATGRMYVNDTGGSGTQLPGAARSAAAGLQGGAESHPPSPQPISFSCTSTPQPTPPPHTLGTGVASLAERCPCGLTLRPSAARHAGGQEPEPHHAGDALGRQRAGGCQGERKVGGSCPITEGKLLLPSCSSITVAGMTWQGLNITCSKGWELLRVLRVLSLGHLRSSSRGQPWCRRVPREPGQRWLRHSCRGRTADCCSNSHGSAGVKPLLSVTLAQGHRVPRPPAQVVLSSEGSRHFSSARAAGHLLPSTGRLSPASDTSSP